MTLDASCLRNSTEPSRVANEIHIPEDNQQSLLDQTQRHDHSTQLSIFRPIDQEPFRRKQPHGASHIVRKRGHKRAEPGASSLNPV